MGHEIWRKSIREAGQSLRRARGGWSCSGVTSAARSCGGAGRSFAVRVRECSFELRIPSNQRAGVLRRWNVVREDRNTPAAWNWGGGPFTCSGAPGQFRRERGPRSRKAGPGDDPGLGRSCRGGLQWLGCGGAASLRWRSALLCSELGGQRRLGFEAAAEVGMGRRAAVWRFKGKARVSACGPGPEISA
jgi:hypothetical protein